jgi:hypothetical protein
LRHRHAVLPALAGLAVTILVLLSLGAAADGWDDRPFGWWFVFGGFAAFIGCGAAWFVRALFRR